MFLPHYRECWWVGTVEEGRRNPAFWDDGMSFPRPGFGQSEQRRWIRGRRSCRLHARGQPHGWAHSVPRNHMTVTAYRTTADAVPSNHCADFAPPSCRPLLVAALPRLCDRCIGYERRPTAWSAVDLTCLRVARQTFLRPRPLTARLVFVPIPTCMMPTAPREQVLRAKSQSGISDCKETTSMRTHGVVVRIDTNTDTDAVETVRCKP